MDTISFYEVSLDEYDTKMAEFGAGNYRFKIMDGVFDMAAYNHLLQQTETEVSSLQETPAATQKRMVVREQELLNQWLADRAANEMSVGELQALLAGESNKQN